MVIFKLQIVESGQVLLIFEEIVIEMHCFA